ncbi:hypothetical protein DPMN_193871 [Dreissena polymorpha]|uniref:Uncharacterized protein n=1 Tax=Dreissena polymorpha TaxID=45954 RepID=A0A9D3Y6E5_DREPO|nr:hypothetical protein DPMN_193871 [Dreissena polymorpha]
MATGRGYIYSKGKRLQTCDRIPSHFTAECGRENILRCPGKTNDRVPDNQSVHLHISTERGRFGFSGCMDHSSAISQIIREAKVNDNNPQR